ncbi:alpha-glycosidase [Marinicrinis lubricantis]|uniref:Alpha-glycosidase n=1 Tax=Marinicrinis lubricantis TaxID=2086470 RepID=A0ABW1IJ55_9BACL
MLLEAVFHRPKMNWSYAVDRETIHLRIRTKRGDAKQITVVYGDKYRFDKLRDTAPMEKFASDQLFDYWQTAVKPPFRRLVYGFLLESENETIWFDEKGFAEDVSKNVNTYFNFPFLNAIDVHEPPAWVKDAVFYQIFPERFANGDPSNDPDNVEPWGGQPKYNNFFGGDLQGVIDHLDHLQELGINAIYFTPIFEATTNHKYDTTDYMKIDPHFGDVETMKRLVSDCHARGIRVMLDAVFNHSGGRFQPFLDVQEKGEASAYKDWFHIREFPVSVVDGVPTYDAFAFEPHMPKLNTEHPEVQAYLLKVARYWIEEIGIDGWRLDVANEVDHQFWREFRKTVKDANPEAYILGEIWHDSLMWLQGDQFDAVMNYLFTNAVLDFFTKDAMDSKQFADDIQALQAKYPQPITEVMFNLLDSHDTARLLHMCSDDKRRMKLAALFQLTYSGAPCIYYGDEIGLTGANDPDCRRCMEWDKDKQDSELFDFYKNLISLRKEHAALRTGSLKFLYAPSKEQVLVYERRDQQAVFVIAMNAAESNQSITFPLEQGRYEEVFTGEALSSDGTDASIELPAYGYTVYKKIS